MSDVQHTDEFGFPLSSTQALLRRRQSVPLQSGATERAGLTPVPVTVHQLSNADDPPARSDDNRSHHAG